MQITIQLTQEEQALVDQKAESWKGLGRNSAIAELEIKENVKNLIARIKMPENINDVPVAESTYKNLRSEYLRIEEDTKKVTSILDKICDRYRSHLKSSQPKLKEFYDKIVSIKNNHEAEEAKKGEKEKEITKVKEYLSNQVNAFDAKCKSDITKLVSDYYTYALSSVGLPKYNTVGKINEYISKIKEKITIMNFVYNPAILKGLVHVTEEMYAGLLEDVEILTDYVALFQSELDKKFAFYENDRQNAEKAIELSKKEAADKEAAILEEQKNKDIAAKLHATAEQTPEVVVPGLKALKKTFAIDMPENMENAMTILAAFIANKQSCEPKLKLKNAYNLSINNMIKALEAMKNEDEAFDVSGLVWKEVSKL